MEAVSNGVQAFREPAAPAARKTLTIIVLTLIGRPGGIATLVYYYGISATDPGQPGYQSVLSLVTAAVAGKGPLYGLTMVSVLLVLRVSANTSFADFPRLCRAVAIDDYLPHSLTARGRRLVYSQGIGVLAILVGWFAHFLRRGHRSFDSTLRRGSLPGLHSLAGGDGGALAQEQRILASRAGQRDWGGCDRGDRSRGGRGQIHPGRMGRRVVIAGGDPADDAGTAPLSAGRPGDRG